ncbi:flagellar biosynthetic protein FliR [Pokkaliibacter sp. CJK22405]|uniref:flagellar biosynthetic protein FliR n=1 Tax=Pokkaliibacter sp. CJK22405 TaxID=3384615 RepID=UPI0039848F28
MIELDVPTLTGWMYAYIWPLFRISGFVMAAPIFGAQMVPARVKIFISLGLAAILAPVVPHGEPPTGIGFDVWVQAGVQTIIGVIMGFALQMLFQIFVVAGQILSLQMGLGFASVNDPVNGVSIVVLSQFYMMLATLIFLLLNGHLTILQMLANSFIWIPVGQWPQVDTYWLIAQSGTWLFASGLSLSLPGMVALLLVNLCLGVITKAAPQLNIFAIGFAFLLVFGLIIFWASMSDMLWQQENLMLEAFDKIKVYLGAS